MKRRRLRIIASLVLLLVFALTGCSSATNGGGASSNGANQTLTIATGSDNTGLDPATVMNNTSGYIMSGIYDELVEYKPGSTEVGPGLAQSWDISPDGLAYTFHLRSGVKFQDGTPCNAQAIVDWLDHLLNKKNPDYYANRQGIDSFVDFTFVGVDSYKALDSNTVQIHMTKPNAGFLNSLAMVWSGVSSPAAVKKYGQDYYKHPVGTGPFKFVEWVPNGHVTLASNPDYWEGKPKVNQVVFTVVPESSVQVLELQKGTVDVLADVSPTDVPTLKKKSSVSVLEKPGLLISGVALPTQTKPFNDVRVRKAFNYAIDKNSLNNFLYKGLATAENSPIPPAQWGYDKTVPGYTYDLQKAKQLLTEAGYPNGLSCTLYAYQDTRSYNPVGGVALAQILQSDLKAIGVTVKIQQLEMGAYLSKVRTNSFSELALAGWSGDNGDPDNFLGSLFDSSAIPSGNLAHYNNPQLETLLAKARVETDKNKRIDLYNQAQKMIMDDAPWIFLNYADQLRATTTKVHGLTLNPTGMFFGLLNVSKN